MLAGVQLSMRPARACAITCTAYSAIASTSASLASPRSTTMFAVEGGAAVPLGELSSFAGASWAEDGSIFVSEPFTKGLLQLPAAGGSAKVVAPGLPDIQWFYSGIDAQFNEPIRRNDELTAAAEYVDVKEVSGKRVQKMLVQTGDVTYTNQHGKLVTQVLSHTFRVPRQSAQGGLRRDKAAGHSVMLGAGALAPRVSRTSGT